MVVFHVAACCGGWFSCRTLCVWSRKHCTRVCWLKRICLIYTHCPLQRPLHGNGTVSGQMEECNYKCNSCLFCLGPKKMAFHQVHRFQLIFSAEPLSVPLIASLNLFLAVCLCTSIFCPPPPSQYAYLHPWKVLIVFSVILRICSMTQKWTSLSVPTFSPFAGTHCIISGRKHASSFLAETIVPKWHFVHPRTDDNMPSCGL